MNGWKGVLRNRGRREEDRMKADEVKHAKTNEQMSF